MRAEGQATVVIPTFHRVDHLGETLAPLLADPATAEVLVVDDGLDDAATRFVRSLPDPRLKAICVENGGQGRARQIGLERAIGTVVVFIDDDVVAEAGLISGHVRLAERGKVVLGYMPTPQPKRRVGAFATNHYIRHYEEHCHRWARNPESVLAHFWSGNFSMMREDALRVGVHNPAANLRYHEDFEFGLRCREAGLRAVFAPDLRARHAHEFTPSQFVANARKQGRDWPVIHALHPELGPFTLDHVCSGRAGPVIRATRRSGGYRLSKCLRPLAFVEPIAEILARIEHQQGALEALRGQGLQAAGGE